MLIADRLWDPSFRLRSLLPFALIAGIGVLAFAALSDAVGEHDGITAVDSPVASWFATHRTPLEGNVGLLLAKMTSPVVLVVLVGLSAALLWWRGRRREGMLLVGATAVAYAAGAVAKFAEHRARPLAPVNLAPEGEPSFPSGHVLVVATIALVALTLAWSHLNTAGRALATLVAAVAISAMAADRLVVGAHWLTDVLGSIAMAAVIAALVGALVSSPALSAASLRLRGGRTGGGEPKTPEASHR